MLIMKVHSKEPACPASRQAGVRQALKFSFFYFRLEIKDRLNFYNTYMMISKTTAGEASK